MEGDYLYARGDFRVRGDFLLRLKYFVVRGQLTSKVVNAV